MDVIAKYQNGNTTVTLEADGTKTREYEGIPKPEYPESIDVKITGYCDLGCRYCHESSTQGGVHADLDFLVEKLKDLPKGTELAIGGGNPLAHPYLFRFLSEVKRMGLIANLTVNQGHLKEFRLLIDSLTDLDMIKGLGISVTSNNFKYVPDYEHVVYHVIAGVNHAGVMERLLGSKVLVLGYKQFGFGSAYYNEDVDKNIRDWYMYLPKYINKCTLSFDNLAIEQLNVERLFTQEGWDKFYMGDDFTFSMYIDATTRTYAPTSRSSDRTAMESYSIKEYFKNFRRESVS